MPDQYSTTRRYKRNFNLFKIMLIASFLMLFIAGIGASIFFKVTEIEVLGVSTYTPQDVIDASGIELGDSLFLINDNQMDINIRNALPFVKTVRIIRTIPNKVTIEVTENVAVAYIQLDNTYWTIDSEGKILKRLSMPPVGLIQIKGLTPISPEEGKKLDLGETGSTALTYLIDLLTAIESEGLSGEIREIDMTNLGNITFNYGERFTVSFGRGDNSLDKIRLIKKAIEGLGESEKGTIEITEDNQARFVPNQNTSSSSQTDTDSDQADSDTGTDDKTDSDTEQ